MAFRFPLAAVLRFRESIEQREERALQKIQLEMARVSHQIDQLTASIAKEQQAREQALKQAIPAVELQTMLWDAQAAVEKRNALVAALHALEQQRIQQMNVYQAAHRDHETLLNTAAEQRSAYELEQARAQQKFLDDIFIARRHRSQ
jgi:flagellar biosynthesis chaperone FliJ